MLIQVVGCFILVSLAHGLAVPVVKEVPVPNSNLKVCAFNIEVFGVAKMGKPHVVEHLVNILIRYDITLIQEIRDAGGQSILELLDELNEASSGDPYSMELSIRLGRTTSKEQYAYFYRPSKVESVRTYQEDPDRENDVFERPPFAVHFKATGHNVGDFGYMGIHVQPSNAVVEIDALADVYDGISSQWNLQDFIIGGDFNAGCTYVRPGDWENIRLRTQNRFVWLIDDNADTNVALGSQCAYDRLVIVGSGITGAYVPNSAGVFYFNETYGLNWDETKEVSDHYPVYMDLN